MVLMITTARHPKHQMIYLYCFIALCLQTFYLSIRITLSLLRPLWVILNATCVFDGRAWFQESSPFHYTASTIMHSLLNGGSRKSLSILKEANDVPIRRAINALRIMSNDLTWATANVPCDLLPQFIWYPTTAHALTYEQLAYIQPKRYMMCLQACIVGNYKWAWDKLLIKPLEGWLYRTSTY